MLKFFFNFEKNKCYFCTSFPLFSVIKGYESQGYIMSNGRAPCKFNPTTALISYRYL